MTAIEELREIKRRRIRAFKLYLSIGGNLVISMVPFFSGLFAIGLDLEICLFIILIIIIVSLSIWGGLGMWSGKFKTIQCPNCLCKLEFMIVYADGNLFNISASRFYCENCGFLEIPPPPSQGTENAHPISYRENGKIIGICMVCNLPITEFEQQLKCPSCSSLAHETHLLEWAKIKGYCPHCNSTLKHILIRDLTLVGRVS
ncbi:MAG: E3 ubiquitin protein ligase [Candidatus Helarchaeota archaeon]|nr:E3 ubiquitin protein ligase [Candidatus Helarchaeota archaeon]